jgi:hypothetical protein
MSLEGFLCRDSKQLPAVLFSKTPRITPSDYMESSKIGSLHCRKYKKELKPCRKFNIRSDRRYRNSIEIPKPQHFGKGKITFLWATQRHVNFAKKHNNAAAFCFA